MVHPFALIVPLSQGLQAWRNRGFAVTSKSPRARESSFPGELVSIEKPAVSIPIIMDSASEWPLFRAYLRHAETRDLDPLLRSRPNTFVLKNQYEDPDCRCCLRKSCDAAELSPIELGQNVQQSCAYLVKQTVQDLLGEDSNVGSSDGDRHLAAPAAGWDRGKARHGRGRD